MIHDAGNMVFEGFEAYRMGLEVLGPYLAHVHLKNARWAETGARDDGSSGWAAGFAPLTAGSVDVPALFGALASVGYDGWVSFEDFSTTRPLLDRTAKTSSTCRLCSPAPADEPALAPNSVSPSRPGRDRRLPSLSPG